MGGMCVRLCVGALLSSALTLHKNPFLDVILHLQRCILVIEPRVDGVGVVSTKYQYPKNGVCAMIKDQK
jgi:hypothetical protein